MKIVSRFFMFLLCLVLASACAQDEPLAPENGGNASTPELSTRTIHMTAGTASAGDATRTTLEGANVLWDEGDQFRVMDTNGLDWVMTADSDAPTHTSGGFTGTTNSTIQPTNSAMAVFPSEGLTAYTDGKLTITIPQTQTYVAGSFDHKANVMVGPVASVANETDTYSAEFYNMMGVLKLQLTGEHDFLTSIKITDKAGKKISGTATLSAKDFSKGISVDNILDGSSSITLNCGFVELTETPTDFYFVVPVGAFSQGFDVEFTNSNDTPSTVNKTSSRDHSIKINSIKKMANMKVDGFEVEEVNIENEKTQQYLKNANYKTWNENSYISQNDNDLKQYINQDKPVGKSITFESNSDEIYVSLIDRNKQAIVYEKRKVNNNKSYTFTNLVPNHIYTYEITDGTNILKAGKFSSKGQLRWVQIDDSWNCRDLGGWGSSLGGSVQYEWLYRTGSLNGRWIGGTKYNETTVGNSSNYLLSEMSKSQILKDLGIKAELDLRARTNDSDGASKIHGLSLGKDNLGINDTTKYCFFNISTGAAMNTPTDYTSDFIIFKRDHTSDPAVVKDVAWIIAQIVYNNRPVAFHCLAGADRTGCVGMIILALLGVSDGNVANDYELTNFSSEKLMLTGTSEVKKKKTISSVSPDYRFFKNGFSTLGQGSMQKNAYYYLNQYFKDHGDNNAHNNIISSTDLDRFIAKMLGLSSYTQDGGVVTGKKLQDIYSK